MSLLHKLAQLRDAVARTIADRLDWTKINPEFETGLELLNGLAFRVLRCHQYRNEHVRR